MSSKRIVVAFQSCAAVLGVAFLTACTDSEVAKRQYLESGDQFVAAGKHEEAIVEYRNAVQQDPRFGEARYKLAESYAATGNAQRAYREYIRAADLLPDNAEAQIKAARFLLLAGQFEDAKTRVQRVLDVAPANVEAQVILGNSLAGLRDFDGAVREIEEAIQLDPGRAQTYSTLAALKLATGNREQAKAAFEKAVAVDARSVPARLALAIFQWSTGDPGGAEQSLKQALEIEPTDVRANRALAGLYLGTNRAAQAEPLLKAVVEKAGTVDSKIQLADYYVATNRGNDALRILEPLAAQKEASGAAESRMAAIVYAAGDKARGHSIVDGVIDREPKNSTALLLKARWLSAEGQQAQALERAQAATAADPSSIAAHYQLGTIQAHLRRTKEAIASFGEVLRLNPRAAAAQIQLSRLHLTEGASDTAVQFAEDALTSAPGNPEARANLVRSLIGRRDLGRAETELKALSKEYPNVGVVHALDAALRLQRKDFAGARAAYERALKLNPNSMEALAGITMLDLREKRASEAQARVETRLAAAPDQPQLLLLAAQVYNAQRDFAKAEATLRRLIQIEPGNAVAYTMLARGYLVQGKREEALAEFDQIAGRDPKNIGAQTVAAIIVQQQQNIPEARKRYEQIINAEPRAAVAANNLAWIYADAGENLDEALKLARSAEAQFPDNPDVHDTIGWVYYQKELPSLAITSFERSIAKAPDNPLYHYHLALAYEKGGDQTRARRAAEQALKIKPDFADAQRMLTSMKP